MRRQRGREQCLRIPGLRQRVARLCEREPSIHLRGVKKVVRYVQGGIKVACRDGKFPFGQ